MPTLARPRPSAVRVEQMAARLATYWDVAPPERPALLVGVVELIDELGCDLEATPEDSPAVLLRLFARARRQAH